MKKTFLYILCSYCTSMEKLQKSDQLLSNKYVYSEKLWCKAANRGVQKKCSYKLHNNHRKAPMPESLF